MKSSNSLTLSGELRAMLKDCKVGESETITITIKPTEVTPDSITAIVTGVAYTGGGETIKEGVDDVKPPKVKGKPKRPKALDMAIAGSGY